MKKTTKKSASKASHKKIVKNLEVKTSKSVTVRGANAYGSANACIPGSKKI